MSLKPNLFLVTLPATPSRRRRAERRISPLAKAGGATAAGPLPLPAGGAPGLPGLLAPACSQSHLGPTDAIALPMQHLSLKQACFDDLVCWFDREGKVW